MKTADFIAENYKSQTITGRDVERLISFMTEEQLAKMGMELTDEWKGKHVPEKPWTKEAILEQLKGDVEFGMEKANNQRGISSSEMYNVVKMWNGILEEGLEDFDDYEPYGMPLFKATAEKYNFQFVDAE